MATASNPPVITPHSDRLIEFAADVAGEEVDSMFVGQVVVKVAELSWRTKSPEE
jgi:hypothetical protein